MINIFLFFFLNTEFYMHNSKRKGIYYLPLRRISERKKPVEESEIKS